MLVIASFIAFAAIIIFLVVYLPKGAKPDSVEPEEQAASSAPKPGWLSQTFCGKNGPLIGCGLLVAVFVGAVLLFIVRSEQRSNQMAAEQRVTQMAADKAQAEEEAENKRKGFHCLSAWDGSEPDVVAAVKKTLRDPDSFEHVRTTITPVNAKGFHYLTMTYRARNGFGGMNVGRVIAHVSPGCFARIAEWDE